MKLLQKCFIFIVIISMSYSGCSSSAENGKVTAAGTNDTFYESLDFDNYGFPVPGRPLKEKPAEIGDNYFIVHDKGGLAEQYINIAIIDSNNKPSLKNIYMVVYRWTGKGFETGYRNSKGMIEKSGDFASNGIEPLLSTIVATPFMLAGGVMIIACGAGGFVIGIAETIPATIDEIKKIGLAGNEMIISITKPDYDSSGRMVKCSTYAASDAASLLFETMYYYKGSRTKPYKTISISNPDKKKRVVYHSK